MRRAVAGIVVAWSAALAVLAALTSPMSAFAAAERISVSGVGAEANFSSRDSIGGRDVLTTTKLFVSTPRDAAPVVGVWVMQTDTSSGTVLFTGTGSTTALSFEVGPQLQTYHLKTGLVVQNQLHADQRAVEVNVVWTSIGDAQAAGTYAQATMQAGKLVQQTQSGVLMPAHATGVVRVSIPNVTGYETTATAASPISIIWDTSSSALWVTSGGADSKRVATETSATSSASTSGYWTGYWTWTWTSQSTGYWYWTWVWISSSGWTVG